MISVMLILLGLRIAFNLRLLLGGSKVDDNVLVRSLRYMRNVTPHHVMGRINDQTSLLLTFTESSVKVALARFNMTLRDIDLAPDTKAQDVPTAVRSSDDYESS
jgi:hypothetical protein